MMNYSSEGASIIISSRYRPNQTNLVLAYCQCCNISPATSGTVASSRLNHIDTGTRIRDIP